MALTKKQRQSKVNKIKRINERRAAIARAVAAKKLPLEYLNTFEAAMRAAVHDNSLFSASGNISHGKKAVDSINTKALDALLKKETAGVAQKKTYKHYQEYIEEQERFDKIKREFTPQFEYDEENPFYDSIPDTPSGYSYEDYILDRNYVYNEIEESADSDWYHSMKAAFQGVSGLKTYAQLRAANEHWKSLTQDEKSAAYQAAIDREQESYFK